MTVVESPDVGDSPLLPVDLDQCALGDVGGEAQRVAPRAACEQNDLVRRWLIGEPVCDGHDLPRLAVVGACGGVEVRRGARAALGRFDPVVALDPVDLDDDAVVELEES